MGDPISREGRLAGLTTAACLLVGALAWLVASLDELLCEGGPAVCEESSAFAGLVWMLALGAGAVGVVLFRSVRSRPVEPDGGEGHVWGPSALFAGGLIAGVTRPPSLTCPAGYHLDEAFRLCVRGAERFPATSWTWLKLSVVVVGIALAVLAGRSPRWVRLTTPLSAGVWLGGMGWLLRDVFL